MKTSFIKSCLWSCLVLAVAATTWVGERSVFAETEAKRGPVLWLKVEGSINPAVDDYLMDGLEAAEEDGAALVVIQLDTPGGLLESTRSIVQRLLAAPVPVAVWVAPAGARAASAGMFITLAANVAAMAPGTNIGAATPISSGGKDVEQQGGKDLARKVLEDTRAFARSIAQVRDRPQDWMEKAVTQAVSATAEEMLAAGVIDLVADSRRELLQSIHGRQVTTSTGAVTMDVAAAPIEPFEMRAGQSLMHWLAHPNIAYLLFLLGLLGIYFELSQPGGFVAGTLGSISLLLAFISMQVLPFRIGGLLLILLSVVLFVAEVFVPSFGILAVGGFVSFVVGSLILFDKPELDIALDPMVIAGAAAAFGGIALAVGFLVMRAWRRQATTGSEGMGGQLAEALTPLNPNGKVFVRGETWNAVLVGDAEIDAGAKVRVVRLEGLLLYVAPLDTPDSAERPKTDGNEEA